MICIEPVVDERAARRRIERKRLARLRRLLGRVLRVGGACADEDISPAASSRFRRSLPYLELVRLPYHHLVFEAATRGVTREAHVLVGGCDGQFTLMDMSSLRLGELSEVETFGATIDEGQAVQLARSGLVAAVLRSPGWGGKPRIGELMGSEVVQYPFWVYYHERRAGRLDIKVLDAVTGKLPGPKVKGSILQAFVRARDG
ncbi:MAG: hypothetical protein JXQ73_18600 [Phycisphaerae bacterium]|nr:hypothetical protein [Phycisphaerae bacterium]